MKKYEFKPDRSGSNWMDRLYLTPQQRMRILKWSLYSLLCVFLLVLQDVAFSLFRPFGGTVDMLVAAVMVVCLLEDTWSGGKFALAIALFYQFSGSSPGHFVIVLLPFLGVFATVFRRGYLQQGFGAVFLCAGGAVGLYELCNFAIVLMMGRTHLGAWPGALMTGVNTLVSIPVLYPLQRAIGKTGGTTWKD